MERYSLQVFVLLSTLMSLIPLVAMITDVPDTFPNVRGDLSKVIWSHATNSKVKLDNALNDDTMMIEADILMGTKHGSEIAVPIMAHPPDITSDLTAEEFIQNVIHANNIDKKKKGIKLDFKQYEAVVFVLQYLKEREDELNFPVWLNADILKGPVNSTKTPMPAEDFINECQMYLSGATLSLGWTTRFGRDSFRDSTDSNPRAISRGQYTQEQLDQMLALVEDLDCRITFPVRAGIAAQSRDTLIKLSALVPDSTLTIWSPADDPVDLLNLTRLIDEFGRSRTYVDLPFDLVTGPKVLPDPMYDGLHRGGGNYSASTSLTASILTTISFILVLLYN